MQDIKSSVCVNYDDTVYAVGKKEPARFSGMMFRGNVEMMDLPIIACDYMNKFQRSAESMGLQDVEFKDKHFTKAVYEYEGAGLKRFKGYTYQSINLAEKCQYYTDVRYKKKDTAKNAQNNAAVMAKMKQGGR